MCRWDCITINERPVSKALFDKVEAEVLQRNKDEDIQASEFEILTATAFDIFTQENVKVAVVEVGMGGRDDATNILKSKDLTIITKIGEDHQAFLGNTIEEIASHKCGIFMKDVPVIYNATNQASVIEVIKEEAEKVGSTPLWPVSEKKELPNFVGAVWKDFVISLRHRDQQKIAINQAWTAFRYMLYALKKGKEEEEEEDLSFSARRSVKSQERDRNTIMNLCWPGRLQTLDLTALGSEFGEILLDGAHNFQAAENLARYTDAQVRQGKDENSITWVVACTKGRDINLFLQPLLRKHDRVVAVEFGAVDGMPWVTAQSSEEMATVIGQAYPQAQVTSWGSNIKAALGWAFKSEDPVVVTGSLYLASDVLRIVRAAGGDIYTSKKTEVLAK
jgi:folylpolyglutamate synthase